MTDYHLHIILVSKPDYVFRDVSNGKIIPAVELEFAYDEILLDMLGYDINLIKIVM